MRTAEGTSSPRLGTVTGVATRRAYPTRTTVPSMAEPAATQTAVLDDREHALRLFRQMALVRRFEERTEEQYTRARIGGYCHLAIGEEAPSGGAIDALVDGDALYASYRDHGTALAVGSPA